MASEDLRPEMNDKISAVAELLNIPTVAAAALPRDEALFECDEGFGLEDYAVTVHEDESFSHFGSGLDSP